jgi:cholesterol transport system auxiliary component
VTTRRSFLLASLALPVSLSGCVSSALSPGAVDTFDLQPLQRSGAGRVGSARQLVVQEPTTLRLYDGERIVVRTRAGEASYLPGAQLIDRLPRLLQARIVQSFENTRRVRAVARPGEGLDPDVVLLTDIRTFGLDASAGTVAEIDLSVRLVSGRNGRVIGSELFSVRTPAASTEPRAVIAALDGALSQVLTRLVDWAARR